MNKAFRNLQHFDPKPTIVKGYQPAPAVLLVSLMNTMSLAMKLTSTTTFKETRMTVLQFLQTAKEKDNAMIVKN